MKDPDEIKRLEIAAYHGAAHAVASYLLHKRFNSATINPEGMKLREIKYPQKISKSIPSQRELRLFKREVMVFLAGLIAELILSGKCEFENILPLLNLPPSLSEDSGKVNKSFWKLLFVETKLLIYAPWDWQAVIVLADELLKQEKIQYQAARKIIKKAIEDYHEGIRNRISASHYSDYSDFVKRVKDARVKYKKK